MANWFKRTSYDSGNGTRTTVTTSPTGTMSITRSRQTMSGVTSQRVATRVSGDNVGRTTTTTTGSLGTKRTQSSSKTMSASTSYKAPKVHAVKAPKGTSYKAPRSRKVEIKASAFGGGFLGAIAAGIVTGLLS